MKYTSRADLLIAAGESIKMQEKAGVKNPMGKLGGVSICALSGYKFDSLDWEFPIAVVEGKPVFVGDELYERNGIKFTAQSLDNDGWIVSAGREEGDHPLRCTWNPSKPTTITITLLREDAESLQDWIIAKDAAHERVMNAIREALEK